MVVAVLGAGYMGGAITFPLADNGAEVRLWGTWLDDEILAACRRGEHPRLKVPLRPAVRLFEAGDLARCVRGADLVVVAVTSEGFLAVFDRFLECLDMPVPVYALTKGFVGLEGRVWRVSQCAVQRFGGRFPGRELRWASMGGPVKAAELSRFIPTCSVHGMNDRGLERFVPVFATRYYRVLCSDDVTGIELGSALKNVYAIGLGLCDGLYRSQPGQVYDNLKAFLFSDACEEMARVVERAGGRRETALHLAGTGDLYVTAQSGRNRRFGELVGSGTPPERAYSQMNEAGEVAEGYGALQLAVPYAAQLAGDMPGRLPLLAALHRIVLEGADIAAELQRYVLSRR